MIHKVGNVYKFRDKYRRPQIAGVLLVRVNKTTPTSYNVFLISEVDNGTGIFLQSDNLYLLYMKEPYEIAFDYELGNYLNLKTNQVVLTNIRKSPTMYPANHPSRNKVFALPQRVLERKAPQECHNLWVKVYNGGKCSGK